MIRSTHTLLGLWLLPCTLAFSQINTAMVPQNAIELDTLRRQVIEQYVTDLGRADYEDITALFEPDGMVTSTSRGKVDAREFFAGFFPEIQSANTVTYNTYKDVEDSNRYVVRFHFDYRLHDGETGTGEYVDEFVFKGKSYHLSMVNMFENLKME